MWYCEDCWCRTSNGVCSNCQEELYIECEQSELIDEPLSSEFREKARAQEITVLKNKKRKDDII